MQDNRPLTDFITTITNSFLTDFVQITLGAYKGREANLKNIYIKKISVKNNPVLSFTYRYSTNDIVKNYAIEIAAEKINTYLNTGFAFGTLLTTSFDLNIQLQKDKWVLKKLPPTKIKADNTNHNRQKNYAIQANNGYLKDLGVTNSQGIVLKNKQDKFVQINHYIDVLKNHIQSFDAKKLLSVVDMGSGKGYLTFALHDYLFNTLGYKNLTVNGVESREDMVALCNTIAKKNNSSGLAFTQNTIENYPNQPLNILIALHACDTATDDAIAYGIKNKAELIVVAPCCHKQIRREMQQQKTQNALTELTNHGIFLERQAEMITDTIRGLILTQYGYKVKVFEFVTDAHTPKNIMLIAQKYENKLVVAEASQQKVHELKRFFSINTHYLERKLLDV
jgi:SAM-dependent methyltransferase